MEQRNRNRSTEGGERARLVSFGTALPPHVVTQAEAAEAVERIFSRRPGSFDALRGVFATAGTRQRHTIKPAAWYLEPQGWPEKSQAFLDGAGDLFIEAAGRALDRAGLTAADVDTVVTLTATGVATPTLEARVAARMGFRPDVRRVPIFGLGCAGGVSGLSIAGRLAAADPGSTVLMVAIECCSLGFQPDRFDKANIVSSALFGDGAAACVLRAGDGGGIAAIEGSAEHMWPDTLGVMGWRMDTVGLGVILAPNVPDFAEKNLGPAVRGMLDRLGLVPDDVGRFVCHPGSVKVVAAIERTLGLDQGSLDHERGVLVDYGNMSAPTVWFILERVMADGALPERTAMLAMGPGFTTTCVSLTRAAA
ncbi:type III polyketide synthase [Prosthecomicrobium sp. N25]|uniref:type III polyketide synthase n=1 Tax=Prosthecomicrobium sp. N25 TaxID=3129254 RepID=UPI0030784C59